MVRKRQDVTDAELAILRQLWSESPATIRQVTDALYDGTDSDYATVKKLLARLEKKGFVRRDSTSTAHAFEATLTQDELLGLRLQGLADNLCEGSRTPLLMHLLRTDELTAKERSELRQLIEQLDRPATRTQRRDS